MQRKHNSVFTEAILWFEHIRVGLSMQLFCGSLVIDYFDPMMVIIPIHLSQFIEEIQMARLRKKALSVMRCQISTINLKQQRQWTSIVIFRPNKISRHIRHTPKLAGANGYGTFTDWLQCQVNRIFHVILKFSDQSLYLLLMDMVIFNHLVLSLNINQFIICFAVTQ